MQNMDFCLEYKLNNANYGLNSEALFRVKQNPGKSFNPIEVTNNFMSF